MSNDVHSFSCFDDLLTHKESFKSWAETRVPVMIEKGLSLTQLLLEHESQQSLISKTVTFYSGIGYLKDFRCAYENPFAYNFNPFLEEPAQKEFDKIVEDFLGNGGILIVPLKPETEDKANINFLCNLLGQYFQATPNSDISRVPFPFMQLPVKCTGQRYRDITYPAGTILWGCYWSFKTQTIDVKRYFDETLNPDDKLTYSNFIDPKNQRFQRLSVLHPYISLDKVSYSGNAFPVTIAAKLYDGAIIGVPEVAIDSLISELISIKRSAPDLKGFEMILELRRSVQVSELTMDDIMGTKAEKREATEQEKVLITVNEFPVRLSLADNLPRVKYDILYKGQTYSKQASGLSFLRLLTVYYASRQDNSFGFIIDDDKLDNVSVMNAGSHPEIIEWACIFKSPNGTADESFLKTLGRFIKLVLPQEHEEEAYQIITGRPQGGHREQKDGFILEKLNNLAIKFSNEAFGNFEAFTLRGEEPRDAAFTSVLSTFKDSISPVVKP